MAASSAIATVSCDSQPQVSPRKETASSCLARLRCDEATSHRDSKTKPPSQQFAHDTHCRRSALMRVSAMPHDSSSDSSVTSSAGGPASPQVQTAQCASSLRRAQSSSSFSEESSSNSTHVTECSHRAILVPRRQLAAHSAAPMGAWQQLGTMSSELPSSTSSSSPSSSDTQHREDDFSLTSKVRDGGDEATRIIRRGDVTDREVLPGAMQERYIMIAPAVTGPLKRQSCATVAHSDTFDYRDCVAPKYLTFTNGIIFDLLTSRLCTMRSVLVPPETQLSSFAAHCSESPNNCNTHCFRQRLNALPMRATISHPCLKALVDVIWDAALHRFIVVTEHVDYDSIASVESDGTCSVAVPMDGAAMVAMGVSLASALAHLHREGIVHGDVCPENVAMSRIGSFLLGGAGLPPELRVARTRQGCRTSVAGGGSLAAQQRQDVAALGWTLYTIGHGRTPDADLPSSSTLFSPYVDAQLRDWIDIKGHPNVTACECLTTLTC